MGELDALALPAYLDKWKVPYRLMPSWGNTWRSSGGFDAVLGFIDHHDALKWYTTIDTAYRAAMKAPYGTRGDGPVGNGCFDIDGTAVLWCAHACNTAGMGGPLLGSRGVIPLDNGNRNTFNMEGRNDGVGQHWSELQAFWKPRFYAAALDWANSETPGAPLGAGDVWGHSNASRGWTARKIDPAGPSPWGSVNRAGSWDMDLFRADVYVAMLAGPPLPPTPSEIDMNTPATAWSPDGNSFWNVVRNGDGGVSAREFINGVGYTDWGNLGGIVTSSPAVCVDATGRVDIVARGGDNALWRISRIGGQWTGWQTLEGISASAPSATASGNRADYASVGADGDLYHRWRIGGDDYGWQREGDLP